MSINNIKKLSMNPHFYSLLMQSFLSGYEKPCEIKLPFMAIPILLYAESREKLVNANRRSRIDTLFQSPQIIDERKISGKTRLSGYVDRYNSLKPYCKEAIIILFSEGKIAFNNHKIVLIKKIDYKDFEGAIKDWIKCAFYLGVVFSKTTEDHLSFFLGVDTKCNEKSTAYIKENLSPLLTDYFALLEQDFDGKISVQKMLKIASDLPEFDDTQLFGENKIAERYSELNAVLENLRNEEREILLKIKNIDNAFDTGSSFTQMLKDLKQQTSIAEIETDEYTCPLCGHECKEIAENDSKLIEATEWLDNELRITEKYTSDFSEDVRKLKESHSKIDEKIRDVWKQIKTIEEKFISSKALVSKREKVNYAKARIALYAEMSSSGIFETVDGDIEELKEKIARLEEKIKGFDVDKKMSKAESFLSNNMNRLSLTLDFEEEYRPIDLNFGLTDGSFDIYQHQKSNENIHLYEMGSGANWVSCHIALFLSFLRFFATQDNSPMPWLCFLTNQVKCISHKVMIKTKSRKQI